MSERSERKPNWDRLHETAAGQDGLFTTEQAVEAGFAPQLLTYHVRTGHLVRVRRGIYRLARFPRGEHEELVMVWLWSERLGVFSHESALSLHGLSDVLPRHIHLTLPPESRRRRRILPERVIVHLAAISREERAWFAGVVPITSVRRTLNDCASTGVAPDLLRQAVHQALRRGLVARSELALAEHALRPFGGLPA